MPTRQNTPKQHDWDAAWHLYLAGASLEEISRMCDIPHNTALTHSKRHFWRQRRTHASKHALKLIQDDLNKRLEQARIKHQHFMLDQLDHTATHIENVEIGNDKDSGEVSIREKLDVMDAQDRIARRVLKLDKEEDRDPLELGFAMLVAGAKALVNEKQAEQLDYTDVDPSQVEVIKEAPKLVFKKPEEEPEKTSSAMEVLPDQPDAFAGILRPFNAPINGPSEPPETLISNPDGTFTDSQGHVWRKNPEYDAARYELDPNTGQIIERKPSDYQAPTPKPLVNENDDDNQATGEA